MYKPKFSPPLVETKDLGIDIIPMDDRCKKCNRILVSRKFWSSMSQEDRKDKRNEFACARARKLCGGCYETLRSEGDLVDYARSSKSLADFVEDHKTYSRRVSSKKDIAKLMGMSYKAWEKAYYRAKEKGLL